MLSTVYTSNTEGDNKGDLVNRDYKERIVVVAPQVAHRDHDDIGGHLDCC